MKHGHLHEETGVTKAKEKTSYSTFRLQDLEHSCYCQVVVKMCSQNARLARKQSHYSNKNTNIFLQASSVSENN